MRSADFWHFYSRRNSYWHKAQLAKIDRAIGATYSADHRLRMVEAGTRSRSDKAAPLGKPGNNPATVPATSIPPERSHSSSASFAG